MSLQWLFYILSLNSFINVLLILRFKKHKYIIYSAYIVCINQILIVILTNCVLCVLHVTSTVWWRGSTRALRWHLVGWCTSHHRRSIDCIIVDNTETKTRASHRFSDVWATRESSLWRMMRYIEKTKSTFVRSGIVRIGVVLVEVIERCHRGDRVNCYVRSRRHKISVYIRQVTDVVL